MSISVENLPIIRKKFEFDSESRKLELIKEVAERVSKVMSHFLKRESCTEEAHVKFRKLGMWKSKINVEAPLPTEPEINAFEEIIQEQIVKALTDSESYRRSIIYSTDYCPEKKLGKALGRVGIQHKKYSQNYHCLFPYKSSVWVCLSENQVFVNLNFEGPCI